MQQKTVGWDATMTDDPFESCCTCCESCCTCCERGYSAGWAASKADEAKQVVGLIEALREIEQQEFVSTYCPDGLPGCAVLHKKRTSAGKIAFEALRAYERGDT